MYSELLVTSTADEMFVDIPAELFYYYIVLNFMYSSSSTKISI